MMGYGKYILTDDGELKPAELMEWAHWFEAACRHIGDTLVGDIHISTVFLGLDHSFGGAGPVLFESMAFGPDSKEQACERYRTLEEAVVGHRAMVAGVVAENPGASVVESVHIHPAARAAERKSC